MKAKPASVHFRANVGFSLSFALLSALVPLLDILTGNLRSRNPDVCPRNPPVSPPQLSDLHQDMQLDRLGLSRKVSLRRVGIVRQGRCRGSSFECRTQMLFA